MYRSTLCGMDRPYRIIDGVAADMAGGEYVVIPLDRDGQAMFDMIEHRDDGRPKPPTSRTIELRAGDEVLIGGGWRRVRSIRAEHDAWLSANEVRYLSGIDGFLYRPGKPR